MVKIRELAPSELDSEGYPIAQIEMVYFPAKGKSGAGWGARYPSLPGYEGGAPSQINALHSLRGDISQFTMEGHPIVAITMGRPRSRKYLKKMWNVLRDWGGANAASEALKSRGDGSRLGVSPTDLFQARSKIKRLQGPPAFVGELTDESIELLIDGELDVMRGVHEYSEAAPFFRVRRIMLQYYGIEVGW